MEHQMNGCIQLCGTCEYWMGPRSVSCTSTNVVLPRESTEGKCGCTNSPDARMDKRSNTTTCACYRKWAILK